eukprot:scaffold9519_cov183-Amphora_coffeaeformis.AAC.7
MVLVVNLQGGSLNNNVTSLCSIDQSSCAFLACLHSGPRLPKRNLCVCSTASSEAFAKRCFGT